MPDDHERVYVLRVWDEEDPPHHPRISLYHALSGERLYFSTLEALIRHLGKSVDLTADPPRPPHLKS